MECEVRVNEGVRGEGECLAKAAIEISISLLRIHYLNNRLSTFVQIDRNVNQLE